MWDAGFGGFSNDAGSIFIAPKGFLSAVKETGLNPDCPALIPAQCCSDSKNVLSVEAPT